MRMNFYEYWVIKNSGLFDPVYYLLHNSDVRVADVDPLAHFIKSGWREGRNPSASFQTAFYLQSNPDVRAAGVNPLIHYLRHGKKEGRLPRLGALPQRSVARTHPIKRFIRKTTRSIIQALPLSIRQREMLKAFLFRHIPWIFRLNVLGVDSNGFNNPSFTPGNLVDIAEEQPLRSFSKQIAVHMHIFYEDLIPEFARHIANMPFLYDLYISVVSEETCALCEQSFKGLPNLRKLTVTVVPNRGRDLAPFFCAFGTHLKQYDVVAHFHTKKSLYNLGSTLGWREYLLSELLGSREQIKRIFSLLEDTSPYGMVYPQTYYFVPYQAHTWLANRALAEKWRGILGFQEFPKGYFDFPVGSMFWARKDALEPLFNAGFTLNDFQEETGQTDGTLAHTLERFLGVSVLNQGMKIAVLKDKHYPSWSSWRLDHNLQRHYADLKDALRVAPIKVIGFDVFDSLLCRPLLDPESTKKIVVRRSPQKTGELFLKYRAIAEEQARVTKGSDVGLDEIYQQLKELSGLGIQQLESLRALEEAVEVNSVQPRMGGIQLFHDAQKSGNLTALITDTFLPEQTIANMLRKVGVEHWDRLFVSNAAGVRKDSGKLYNHVLTHYKIKPDEFVMTGDNERSDFQIPVDCGAHSIHILRPTEIGRGTPRLAPLVNLLEKRSDLDEELTFGPVLLHNFSPIVYPEFDPTSLFSVTPENIGYSLIGPLLVSFSQWLLEKSRGDKVERLYFLSREGKLMKAVYDTWTADLPDAPRSEYLVISRRCSSMAALSSFEDILDIARTTYFPNSLDRLLNTRYGITPSAEKWQEISRTLNLNAGSILEIRDKKIGNLEGVLHLLREEISDQARSEQAGLLCRLEELHLPEETNPAVVDVGYGGTVQGHMNKILAKPVHGYYLLTEDRSRRIADHYGVMTRGCFGEDISGGMNAPIMFRYSFQLEKFLSSNDPQIEYYGIKDGRAVGHFRPLMPAELKPKLIRDQIHAGAVKYAQDLKNIRQVLLPDFHPSTFVALSLLEAFLSEQSTAENALLASIVLDDYYCGRDLVA